jgi:hypothetical protein
MSEYEQQADAAEREADDMEKRSERLGAQIHETREDWERKKRDDSIPTADDPHAAEEDLPPEADEGGE